MAIFSNQATLTVNGTSTNSNIAYGEILDVLTVSKTAVENSYSPDGLVTYVVALRNTSGAILSDLTVTDDLGGYDFNGTTVYPLRYVADSATLYVNGVLQAAPTVVPGPPMVVSGISIPAGGNAVLVYQAQVTAFADPTAEGVINNTVSVSGDGLSAPISDTESVPIELAPMLSISKSITPAQVTDNDTVTYTFVIENSGNRAVVATDDAVITDVFNPRLSALAVSFNGVPWTQGVQYSYDEASGLFTTAPGQIVVPAASYTQDPTTGAYTAVPGIATLTVSGTI